MMSDCTRAIDILDITALSDSRAMNGGAGGRIPVQCHDRIGFHVGCYESDRSAHPSTFGCLS